MPKNQRTHQRYSSLGNIRIQTSIFPVAYTVSLNNISKSGAFICTTHLPEKGEIISFEILDDYGLRLTKGKAQVVRVLTEGVDSATGFAVRFDKQLEQAMLDQLWQLQAEAAC